MQNQLESVFPAPFWQSIIDALNNERPFVFSKINHGFWEMLAKLERLEIEPTTITPEVADRSKVLEEYNNTDMFHSGFLAELIQALQELPSPDSGYTFVGSLDNWPFSYEIEGTPFENIHTCRMLIEKYVPKAHRDNHKQKNLIGDIFKTAIFLGRMQEFTSVLAQKTFIMVANEHLNNFPDFIGAKKFFYLPIHASRARRKRRELLEKLIVEIDKSGEAVPTIIMQAGGSLSAWLCFEVYKQRPCVQIFDLGDSMGICAPNRSTKMNWGFVYRQRFIDGGKKILTARQATEPVISSFIDAATSNVFSDRITEVLGQAGIPPLTALMPEPAGCAADQKAPFIENKYLDMARIEEILEHSKRRSRFANFGPATELLSSSVKAFLTLPEHQEVLTTSSATTALMLAAGAFQHERQNQKLKWVTSAFTFFSANIGPFSDSIILDCNERGALSLEALKSLPIDDWDGVIYTNVFAQNSNCVDLAQYCAAHGKHLIIDNATGLLDRPRVGENSEAIEVISCHQTKSWGMGEGGLIIASHQQKSLMQKLANFGANLSGSNRQLATNGKMSDLTAAAILTRIEQLPQWERLYNMQKRRILSVIGHYGIPLTPLLGNWLPLSPGAFTPLISEDDVPMSALNNEHVNLGKYYRPLGAKLNSAGIFERDKADTPNAIALYNRIICVPNAPHMRYLSTDRLVQALEMAASAGNK